MKKCSTVYVNGKRTSFRLEAEEWDAMEEISKLKEMSRGELCEMVRVNKEPGMTLSSAMRVFFMLFYRNKYLQKKVG